MRRRMSLLDTTENMIQRRIQRSAKYRMRARCRPLANLRLVLEILLTPLPMQPIGVQQTLSNLREVFSMTIKLLCPYHLHYKTHRQSVSIVLVSLHTPSYSSRQQTSQTTPSSAISSSSLQQRLAAVKAASKQSCCDISSKNSPVDSTCATPNATSRTSSPNAHASRRLC